MVSLEYRKVDDDGLALIETALRDPKLGITGVE
jgi:hypothetical protein